MNELDLQQVDKATTKLESEYLKIMNESYNASLKDVQGRIAKIYSKYSIDGKLDLQLMSKKDIKKMPRLYKLFANIDKDLSSLNRGKPQQLSSYLTDAYLVNREGTAAAIQSVANASFDVISREQVYQSALNPLSKLALQSNAQAIKINIQRSITASILQGEGIQKMSRRIKKDLQTNANRAVTIARTETTKIVNQARDDILVEAQGMGINVKKEWVSAQDDRVRATHAALNGEIRDMDKPFSNGLMRPGDPSGPPSQIINCRCTMVGVLPDYE